MTDTKRDSIRWGDQINEVFNVGIAAVTRQTREVCRVQAPEPCLWSLFGSIEGVAAADLALFTFNWVWIIGVGSARIQVVNPVSAAAPFGAAGIPAEFISVFFQATGVPAVGGTWTFKTICAPTVPWRGMQVQPDPSVIETFVQEHMEQE